MDTKNRNAIQGCSYDLFDNHTTKACVDGRAKIYFLDVL